MVDRVEAWRLAVAGLTGVALGVVVCIAWPRPSVPFVAVETGSTLPTAVLPSNGIFRFRGTVPPVESSARILFVGDMMFDRNVAARMKAADDPAYPFHKLPPGWFDSFDYAVANLEGVVTDKRRAPEKSIDFQFDPSVIATLQSQGIDAFSQANNHALDQGAVGYADSVRRLREAGFLVFGHQVRDDAVSLATTTIKGIRVAFLGFNTTDNALDRAAAAPILAQAASSSDVVIAYVHWGIEYQNKPDPASVELAHWLIDHGVDAVIGGHPHWVRGFSSYKGKPIAWSLGNFIFDQDFSLETRQGLALGLTVRKSQVAGRKMEISIEPIPVQIDKSQPRIVEGEERTARLEALSRISDPELREQELAGKMGF